MADSGLNAIDRVFDLVDNAVEKVDRVLNRTKYTEQQHRARRSGRVIDTSPSVKVKAAPKAAPKAAESSSTAVATRARFRIVEAIAAETGVTIFVVTNGAQRAECTTRELAEKILGMLEASAS